MKKILLLVVLAVVLCSCGSNLKPGVTYYVDKKSSSWTGIGNDTYRIEFTIYEDGSVSGKGGVLVDGELPSTDCLGAMKLEGTWSEVSKNDKKFIEIDALLDGSEEATMYVDDDLNIYLDGVNSEPVKLQKK